MFINIKSKIDDLLVAYIFYTLNGDRDQAYITLTGKTIKDLKKQAKQVCKKAKITKNRIIIEMPEKYDGLFEFVPIKL